MMLYGYVQLTVTVRFSRLGLMTDVFRDDMYIICCDLVK